MRIAGGTGNQRTLVRLDWHDGTIHKGNVNKMSKGNQQLCAAVGVGFFLGSRRSQQRHVRMYSRQNRMDGLTSFA
jgi:hypothetical protein